MANYTIYGNSSSMFEVLPVQAGGTLWKDVLLYVSPTEFGITNSDGSQTFYLGSGIVWDHVNNTFQGGTVTRIVHFANGQVIDELNGISLTVLGDTLLDLKSDLLSGNDVLDARNRVDYLTLPSTLNGYGGDDQIYGGNGTDQLLGGDGSDTITGAAGNDMIDGGAGNDVLAGDAGNDRIVAGDGDDSSNGGIGNDNIAAGGGNDTIMGGTGADRLQGGLGMDNIDGGSGNDIIHGGQGGDVIDGNSGTDTAVYSFSISQLHWEKTATGFRILTEDGIDTLSGIERIGLDDGTYGWDGLTNNWVRLSNVIGVTMVNPSGFVRGTAGADVFNIAFDIDSTEPFVFKGLGGDDTITSYVNESLIFGGSGNDTIDAGGNFTQNARVYGESGNDKITVGGSFGFADGGAGNDDIWVGDGRAFGGDGNDLLRGGASTKLWGGNGDDVLRGAGTATGGAGADTFSYEYRIDSLPNGNIFIRGWGNVNVTDFEVGTDHLDIRLIGNNLTLNLQQVADGYLLTASGPGGPTSTITFNGLTAQGLTLDDFIL